MPWIFGYGSLVDRESLESSLGRPVALECGPFAARLPGYRRSWNVAAHTSLRPGFVLTTVDDGQQWTGYVVFLGIEADGEACALGAVYEITDDDLVILDHRELSYDRLLQTVHLAEPLGDIDEVNAFVYVPKDWAHRNADAVGSDGVIMARYPRLVDKAFRALGSDLYAEHIDTMPNTDPFTVREIMRHPVTFES